MESATDGPSTVPSSECSGSTVSIDSEDLAQIFRKLGTYSSCIMTGDGTSRPGSRTSIESIMFDHPHPYRADDDQSEPTHYHEDNRKLHNGVLTPEEEKEVIETAFKAWGVAGKLHGAIRREDIADAAVRTALRENAPLLTSGGSEKYVGVEMDPLFIRADEHIRTCRGCSRPAETHQKATPTGATPENRTQEVPHSQETTQIEMSKQPASSRSQQSDRRTLLSQSAFSEDDEEDDLETDEKIWKLGAEMTFALGHLRTCTDCWFTFDQISIAKKELEKYRQRASAGYSSTPEIPSEELSQDEVEAALSEDISALKQHKEFITGYMEQAYYDMASATDGDGEIAFTDCVFGLAMEHLKRCPGCPGKLAAQEVTSSWTHEHSRRDLGQEFPIDFSRDLGEAVPDSSSLILSPFRTESPQLQPSSLDHNQNPNLSWRFPYATSDAPTINSSFPPEDEGRGRSHYLRRHTSDLDYHECSCIICGRTPLDFPGAGFSHNSYNTPTPSSQASSRESRSDVNVRSPRSSTPALTPPPGAFLRPVRARSPGRSACSSPAPSVSDRYSCSPGRSSLPPLTRRVSSNCNAPPAASPSPRRCVQSDVEHLDTITEGNFDSQSKEVDL